MGGPHIQGLKNCICDPEACAQVSVQTEDQECPRAPPSVTRNQRHCVPGRLLRFLLRIPELEDVRYVKHGLAAMQLSALPEVRFQGSMAESQLEELATDLIVRQGADEARSLVSSVVVAGDALKGEDVQKMRDRILEDYATTVFTTVMPKQRPVRGPFGEATIELKPGTEPARQRAFHLHGERREALNKLVEQLEVEGKLEPGAGPWSSPAFPVPKKRPGEYRLVVDYRAVNDATIADAHPLPRIEDILQRQGSFRIWSVLDMKDGYHQVPLKKEHRHLTCMTTPRGVRQWTVLVLGLKNGGAIFQRMMEWVLQGLECADVYIDDVIVGSTGETLEECLVHHDRDIRQVLDRLQEHALIVDKRKAHLFTAEVEFCGHVLREGRREPAPGKLLSIQKWELPRTVTQLRGFLGLTNYYSSYVPNYAEFAGPLMGKLQLNREDGKKGSTKPIVWKESEKLAFAKLKELLARHLELFRVDPDKPFVLRTDASDKAVGAVLEQHREVNPGQTGLVPVAFFSRKLGKHQLNWTPREKETYAVVSALRKWSGWIGLQPVLVLTDHKSLEDWVREKVDTPSGPAGRRARWHETLSKFDLTVQYMPGKDNVVADALSRFAYPACKAFQDTSFHGSEEARLEMKKIIEEELAEGRTVGMITGKPEDGDARLLVVAGTISKRSALPPHRVCVLTRSGRKVQPEPAGEEDSDDGIIVDLTPDVVLEDEAPPAVPPAREAPPPEVPRVQPPRAAKRPRAEPPRGPVEGPPPAAGGPATSSSADLQGTAGSWPEAYATSAQWGDMWQATRVPGGDWPTEVRLQGEKMLWQGRICVPESKVEELLREFHSFMGHPGVHRLVKEVDRRYVLPETVKLFDAARGARRGCATCQACEAPNWSTSLPITHTPIPGYVMSSVSLDVFALPAVRWGGQSYDSMLLCVDRLSGWIIARPCQKLGLTAEKAAHLVMDNGWETFGIPSVITSDQGSQFIGQWWKTMCARLGIRQAYSQAYRPQANGRAEVAGKTVIGIMRKFHTEEKLNWVEALPRVLRAYHDNPGESGLSPFQIVFGRERNLAGAPYEIERECEGAQAYFTRMESLDRKVADELNRQHAQEAQRLNASRARPQPFQEGDVVWVLRPKSSNVSKLDTWWVGPAKVTRRIGDQSYQVLVKPGVVHDVHMDQLKRYVDDTLEGSRVELFHHSTGYKALETQPDEWSVETISGHRRKKDGTWEFLTLWEGCPESEKTWEPAQNFITRYCVEFPEYLRKHRIDLGLSEVLKESPESIHGRGVHADSP